MALDMIFAMVGQEGFWYRMCLVVWICSAVFMFPVYRSTDFDVHRHWKAITRHLPVQEWYFDDNHIQTRHTLDYPPAFAYFEAFLSRNLITHFLLDQGWVEERCLQLLSDRDLEQQPVSQSCVAFMRTTVLLAQILWWIGSARVFRQAVMTTTATVDWGESFPAYLMFAFHPALLWLDHVHFQYNGMMLGILLISISCLLQANNVDNNRLASNKSSFYAGHALHLVAAATFALLLMFKHLYLSLAPWYLFYLMRRYCFEEPNDSTPRPIWARLSWRRLVVLGMVTVMTMVLPLVPLLWAATNGSRDKGDVESNSSMGPILLQLQQIVRRLFPFGRGLVHDYWAGNFWALFTALDKCLRFLKGRMGGVWLVASFDLPNVTPFHTAIMLALTLVPGCLAAWKAAATRSNSLMLLSISYCGLAAFLTSFHVHEKAILTGLIPIHVYAATLQSSKAPTSQPLQDLREEASLWIWEWNAWALLSLCPLLFRPAELLFKVFSMLLYLSLLWTQSNCGHLRTRASSRRSVSRVLTAVLVSVTWLQLEVLPIPSWQDRKLEFMPLAVTSLVCSIGYLWIFARISLRLFS